MSSNWIVVDVEANGPCPGLYSMVSFGAVVVEPQLRSFFGRVRPLYGAGVDEAALAISGVSQNEHATYPDPFHTLVRFKDWLSDIDSTPILVSDNPAFDWQYINYYFHRFLGSNPFGWSARRISDLYCGMKMDAQSSWKHLRKTKHTHNPVDDAKGNAEAVLEMINMGLRIPGYDRPKRNQG